MDKKVWCYGCLFYRTSAEVPIASYINQTITDVEAVAPARIRRKNVSGKIVEDRVQLLSRYIFFRTEFDEQISQLTRITNIFKLLEHANFRWKLIGEDKAFTEYLFDNDLL